MWSFSTENVPQLGGVRSERKALTKVECRCAPGPRSGHVFSPGINLGAVGGAGRSGEDPGKIRTEVGAMMATKVAKKSLRLMSVMHGVRNPDTYVGGWGGPVAGRARGRERSARKMAARYFTMSSVVSARP